MKILHVCKKYPNALGGDAIVVSNLEKQQKSSGHHVAILTSNCNEISNGSHIYKFGLSDTPSRLDNITLRRLISLIMLFFKAFKVLHAERPDVIHTHSIDMAYFISFAARYYKIPIVHTFHIVTFNDNHHSPIRRKSELFLLRGTKPKTVLVLNPADIKSFEKAGFINTKFIPNGINLDEWSIEECDKKKEFNNDKGFLFLAVGRLEEQKGFEYLIKAAAILKRKNEHFQIQIVGDGPLKHNLQNLIYRLDVVDQVSLLGKYPYKDMKLLYAKADAFILASLWEAFPMTILEAWAAELPVIATRVGSIPAVCTTESNILIQPANEDELALAMDLMAQNISTEKRQIMIETNLRLIREQFNWRSIAKQVEQVYGSKSN